MGSKSIIGEWDKVFMKPEGLRLLKIKGFWTDAHGKAAVGRAADGDMAT